MSRFTVQFLVYIGLHLNCKCANVIYVGAAYQFPIYIHFHILSLFVTLFLLIMSHGAKQIHVILNVTSMYNQNLPEDNLTPVGEIQTNHRKTL